MLGLALFFALTLFMSTPFQTFQFYPIVPNVPIHSKNPSPESGRLQETEAPLQERQKAIVSEKNVDLPPKGVFPILSPSSIVIVGSVFLFFFCLDALGSAFIHSETRNDEVGVIPPSKGVEDAEAS